MSKANITEWERGGVLSSLPTEVCVYLSAVALCLVLVIVFYLYLSQLICFKNTRRILCLAQHDQDESEDDSVDGNDEASCDSDVEDLKRYQRIARHPSRRDSDAAAAAATNEASLKKPVKSPLSSTFNCPTLTGSDVPPLGAARNVTDRPTPIRTTDTTASSDTTQQSISTTCAVASAEKYEPDCEILTFSNEAFCCEGDDDNVEMTTRSKSKSGSRQQSLTQGDVPSDYSTDYNCKDSFEVLPEEEHNDRGKRSRTSVVSSNTLEDEDYDDTVSENPDEEQSSRCRSSEDAIPSTRHRPGVPLTVWKDPATGAEDTTVGGRCGSLRLTFFYDGRRQRLSLVVHEAAGLPDYDDETTTSALKATNYNTQVRMLLLPGRNSRYRTKIRTGDRPTYEETFHLKIKPESVPQMGMRLRLYGSERLMRLRLIGETIVAFATLDLHPPLSPSSSTTFPSSSSSSTAATVGLPSVTQWFVLEPRYNVTQSESMVDLLTMMRLDHYHAASSPICGEPLPPFPSEIPQLLIGLSYNEVTGRLSVEINKGFSFTSSTDTRSPDTYVKMTLMSPDGREMGSSKTSVRRGKPSPFYGETFMFSVAQFQLPDVSLMVSVYNIWTLKRRHMMGWFTLGYTNSTEYEREHWNDMRDSKGEQVTQWHLLLEP